LRTFNIIVALIYNLGKFIEGVSKDNSHDRRNLIMSYFMDNDFFLTKNSV